MILLDTNVVSEPLRRSLDLQVVEWLDSQPLETLYLSTMTIAELRAGVALLPVGKRRTALRERLENEVFPLFTGRVLAFDLPCTQAYADLLAKVRSKGRAIGTADACIAAVAVAHRFVVATRDENPFSAAGLRVIDPWAIG